MAQRNKRVIKMILWFVSALVFLVLILAVNLYFFVRNEKVVSEGKPIANYSTNHPALLVVDIQEVITGKSSIYPGLQKKSEVLIKHINRVIDSFQVHHYPIIYVRSEIANPLINVLNDSYAKGSEGVQYDPRLNVVSDLEVIKTGQDSFRKTKLDEILTHNKVNELYLVGLDAAECVNTTVAAAQNRNYKVNLIREAVISKTRRATDSMMVSFRNRGVHLVRIDSLSLGENFR